MKLIRAEDGGEESRRNHHDAEACLVNAGGVSAVYGTSIYLGSLGRLPAWSDEQGAAIVCPCTTVAPQLGGHRGLQGLSASDFPRWVQSHHSCGATSPVCLEREGGSSSLARTRDVRPAGLDV